MKTLDKLCSYPWNAAAVRPDGLVLPCCVFNDDTTFNAGTSNVNLKDLRNAEIWKSLRETFIAGNPSKGCDICFNNEIQGLTSLREYGIKRFPIPVTSEVGDLIMLEIAFSNLCNLACVHCSGYFSTKWQTEDNKYGRTKNRGIINIVENSLDQWDLSQVRYLKIIGGEPMMEQDKFIRLLDRIDLPRCKIQICTNGTQKIRPDLVDRLNRAEAVLIALSMDGTAEVNDWCRWPSRWVEQETRIKEYDSLFKDSKNVYLHFHHCVSIFNVFDLTETVEYVLRLWPRWKIQWDWVDHPLWQSVAALPQIAKQQLEQQLSKYALLPADDRLCGVNPYKDTLNKMKNSVKVDWKTCVSNIHQLADERNLDINKLLPKLTKYI